MNKNTVSIMSLVAGILTAVVALFCLICGIMNLTNFNGDAGAKYNIYVAIAAILLFAETALLGIFSFFIIKGYVNKTDNAKYMPLPALIYFCHGVLSNFIGMIFTGFNNGTAWVFLILSLAGAILILLTMVAKLEKVVNGVLVLIAMGLGFVLSIIALVNTGGIGIALNLFIMFMFIAFFLYYLFDMIVDGTFAQKNTTESAEAKEE